MRPGATQLTVMPCGPTSRLSVLSQPMSAGRNVFESARCVVGSSAASELTATIRPPALLSRCGSACAHERDGGAEEEAVRAVERLGVGVERAAGRRAAAVPDEDVETAEAVDGGRDGALESSVVGHVPDYGDAAQPGCVLLELVGAAREEDDVRALLRERLGAREPEPGRGAADERGAPAQPEIHAARLTAKDAFAVVVRLRPGAAVDP